MNSKAPLTHPIFGKFEHDCEKRAPAYALYRAAGGLFSLFFLVGIMGTLFTIVIAAVLYSFSEGKPLPSGIHTIPALYFFIAAVWFALGFSVILDGLSFCKSSLPNLI